MGRPIGTDEMLDRIEELEAKLAKADVTRWNAQLERYYKNTTGNALTRPKMHPDPTGRYVLASDYFEMLDRIEELEAKLSKAAAEIEEAWKVPKSDASYGILQVMIKYALAELKGQDDVHSRV